MLTRLQIPVVCLILVLTVMFSASACSPALAQPTATIPSTPEVRETTRTDVSPLPSASPSPTSFPLTWPTMTPFANELTFKVMGQFGGPARAVAVKDHVAYLGIGPQVLILDVSNPALSRQIGQSGAFLDFVQDIVTVGDLVYIAAGRAGLHIMDLTKPLQPRQVGFIPSEGSFEKVIVREAKAFIAETLGEYSHQQNVIRLFDVSDPGNPRELNSQLYGRLLDVQGSQVYAIQDDVLKVIDISLPMSLKATDTGLKNVSAVAGQYVYTIDVMNNMLGIVDLSDPGNPRPRGSLKFEDGPLGRLEGVIVINTNLIYVKNTFWGESGITPSSLFLVDVSNPVSPRQLGNWSGSDEPSDYGGIPGAFVGEVREDNFLYLALGSIYSSNGLWIVDIHDPTHLLKVGSFSAFTGALNAVRLDKFAYVLRFGFPNDLTVIDLTQLNNIRERKTVDGVSSFEEIPLKGHYLYFPGSQGTILDLTDPASPLHRDEPASGLENSMNIQIAGEHACVSNFNGGLSFVDLSNPAQPYLISHLDTETIYYLACANTEAFYITWNYPADITALHIADISDITRPVEVFSQDLSIYVINDIAYDNGYLYVTASPGYIPSYHEQLLVFDVSDHVHAHQISAIELGSHISNVSVLGHYAYLAGEDITVFDISDPAHPRPVGKTKIPGGAFRLTVLKQDTLLVPAYGGGIFLMQINGLK